MNDARSDFGFFKLMPFLRSLGCEGQVISDATIWFWRQSKTWVAETEDEFGAIARAELTRQFGPAAKAAATKSYGERWRERQAEIVRHNYAPLGSPPLPEPWTPCEHWRPDSAKCVTCKKCIPPGSFELLKAMHGGQDDTRRQQFVRSRIRATCFGLTDAQADDLAQEVWRKVARGIAGFKPNPGLSQDGSIAWLRNVVHSVVLDYAKRNSTKAQKLEVEEGDTSRVPLMVVDGLGDAESPLDARKTLPDGAGPDD
jgi:hypothetical protein